MVRLVLEDDQAVVALGANLGDPRRTLAEVRRRLPELVPCELLASSRLYDTDPEPPGQPRYANAALRIRTTLAPEALLAALLAVEAHFGRLRVEGERHAPRTLDLDLVLFGAVEREGAGLHLPHPRALDRAFVVAPLLDVIGPQRTLEARLEALGGPPVVVDWPE